MSRSLNPNATPPVKPVYAAEGGIPPRRNALAAVTAIIVGTFVGLIPLGAGVATFLDPLLRRKKGGREGSRLLRVASLDAIPTNGTPIQVPVIADLTDAWNREANQPIGAVYLRRDDRDGQKVVCFNAICPHAGCFVGYAADRKVFQCPCHTSSFQLDGERIMPSPSPRNMDELKVDDEKLKTGEVWIEFVNYYPGKEDREEKPS